MTAPDCHNPVKQTSRMVEEKWWYSYGVPKNVSDFLLLEGDPINIHRVLRLLPCAQAGWELGAQGVLAVHYMLRARVGSTVG